MSATCCIFLFAGTKNDYPQYNIPPVRKLLPFRLRRLQNLRIDQSLNIRIPGGRLEDFAQLTLRNK